MPTIDERIAELERKLRQEKAKKQQIEARRRAVEQRRPRTEDTRRKVLVGAIVLARVERGDWPRAKFLDMLDKALTRPDDRALFDLPAAAPAAPAVPAVPMSEPPPKRRRPVPDLSLLDGDAPELPLTGKD